jgi:hypothetical protein
MDDDALDPELVSELQRIADLPLDERADALEALSRRLSASLEEITSA